MNLFTKPQASTGYEQHSLLDPSQNLVRSIPHPRRVPRLRRHHSAGNSLHTHISIHSTSPADPNSLSNGTTMQPHEASFLGSVLDHLPALCAFTLPTEASYARVKDGMRSGGTYVCWGSNDNREAPLRLCGSPGSHHIGSLNTFTHKLFS